MVFTLGILVLMHLSSSSVVVILLVSKSMVRDSRRLSSLVILPLLRFGGLEIWILRVGRISDSRSR